MAANVPLDAYKRVPFVEADGATWVFVGFNYSAATFLMHLRNEPGDTGTPLLALGNATAGSQGISATYVAEYIYVDPDSGAMVTAPATKVLAQIDEATLEGLTLATPASTPLKLHYDLHITPSGGVKRVGACGLFRILPGVTI